MSDGTEPQGSALDSAGAALHAERGRQGLSVGDVSRHLKLSVRQVEALERDDYQVFGGSVFVHGFLRNYAKLLGLDAALLIGAADRKLEAEATPAQQADRSAEVELEESEGDGQKSVMPLFLVAAILVGGVAAWMLIGQKDAGQDEALSDDIVASQLAGEATNGLDSAYNGAAPLTEPGAEVALAPRQDAAVGESGPAASQSAGRSLAQAPQIRLQLGFREVFCLITHSRASSSA